MFWDWTYIFILPGILLAMWAQARVQGTYRKYSQVNAHSGMTADQVARALLDDANLRHVRIEPIAGILSDNYDPRDHVLRLSQDVYGSPSVAALGIAAHEVGHAVQHEMEYAPLKIRNALVPVANLGSYLAWPLVILGMVFSWLNLIYIGILVFAVVVFFQLVTLPVEYNASARATELLRDGGYLQGEELDGARKVLSSAALTYLAATLTAILQLMRLMTLAGVGRRRS